MSTVFNTIFDLFLKFFLKKLTKCIIINYLHQNGTLYAVLIKIIHKIIFYAIILKNVWTKSKVYYIIFIYVGFNNNVTIFSTKNLEDFYGTKGTYDRQ